MALPTVHCTIEDRYVVLNDDWQANSTALGGFDQFSGSTAEDVWRSLPSSVGQGSTLTLATDANNVVWQGRLAGDPQIEDGVAHLRAQGEQYRAVKYTKRLFYQRRGYDVWQDGADAPFDITVKEDMEAEVREAALFFRVVRDSPLGSGDIHALVAWQEGATITRYAFDIVKTTTPGTLELRTRRFTGPTGAKTSVQTHSLAGAVAIDQAVASAEDALTIELRANAATTLTNLQVFRLKNVRINGRLTADSHTSQAVMQDAGAIAAMGYDTSGVSTALNTNVMPLDWENDSAAGLFDYLSMIEDAWWRVVDDRGSGPYLEANTWANAREWTVAQGDGAVGDLVPQELYNEAVVTFRDDRKRLRRKVVSASPDPLAGTGITNSYPPDGPFELLDFQVDATLATTVATKLIAYASAPRAEGPIHAVRVIDLGGRDNPYGVRGGDVVTITDGGPAERLSRQRVQEVSYSARGVTLGVESPATVAGLIERLRLKRARRRQDTRPSFRGGLRLPPTKR